MKQDYLIQELSQFFDIREFVSPRVYNRYRESSWRFFDPRLLETMLHIRVALGVSITANNWHRGGRFKQRGLRSNLSDLVLRMVTKKRLYLSGHVLGMALDFDVKGYQAEDVRQWLIQNQEILPYKIRLEYKILRTGKIITWVHLDVEDEPKNPKVYLFCV